MQLKVRMYNLNWRDSYLVKLHEANPIFMDSDGSFLLVANEDMGEGVSLGRWKFNLFTDRIVFIPSDKVTKKYVRDLI